MANSLSLMAIGLLLDLFSSDFAIVSTPSEQSIIIDCKRHPTNYTINRLPLFAIICHRLPRVYTVNEMRFAFIYTHHCQSIARFTPWAVVCRVFDAGREMSMRVSLGSPPLFSNFHQSLPTDSRNQLWT